MSSFKLTALGLAAAGMALSAIPASAHEFAGPAYRGAAPVEQSVEHSRGRDRDRDGWGRDYRYGRYDEPVYRDTPTWRGRDGRYYCRKKNGTTGLIVGAAAGALLGREVDRSGERTTGTILGAAAGALLGRSVDRGSRCH